AMETQVKAAIASSDYKQASKLLKQWQTTDAKNPLLRFYAAQLQEHTHRLEAAEKNYTKLLQQNTNRKVMSQARAGIERIRQKRKAKKEADIAEARSVDGAEDGAILVIASPGQANRPDAIAGLAKVFSLDAYTARMKLPSSGFRIYRVGPWGELNYFQQQLTELNTPASCTKLSDIKSLQTFQISHFETLSPQPTVICKNAEGQLGKISFDWAEVTQQVHGQLPIFEQVVDLGNWGRTVHKEKVQDYAQVVDLHLPGREIVLRACDRFYQYKKGTALSPAHETNSRIKWNQLIKAFSESTQAPCQDDFSRFGKSTLEFINLLPTVHPYLDIDRRAPSDWDLTFHLYSSLCYASKINVN
ncbi:MAG: hypothetical protein AAFN12_07450, partial [Cyanobacteria bacterium J06560_2]